MKRIAIVITHPIQYYVPVFKLLAKECKLKVFYSWGERGIQKKFDPGFGKEIAWDLPLLEGYDYELLTNTAKDPGSHHGKGIINPDILIKINDFAPEAILIYGYVYESHFKVMRQFKGKIPIWFRGDSTLLDQRKGIKSILKWLYLNWVYSKVDKAFYVGKNNKAYFKKYGLKESKLIFAPHAIDNERFGQNRKQEALVLRENLGIGKGDILILFAGKLELKKDPELLLDAFLVLIRERERNKDQKQLDFSTTLEMTGNGKVHLLFVGNGELEEKLKRKAKNEKRETRNVHFMDFQNQSQMPVAYQASDVFCLPSQGPGETWGLAINEAMAAGKAIITSNKVGCYSDLVIDNVNGYVFPSKDVDALKDRIAAVIDNPQQIIKFGKKSKEIIQNWSFQQQVTQFIKTLNATN